tara:strand:- start:337 stop:549 length:213 start_codon:yes stop_codon:yes gene_type:complete
MSYKIAINGVIRDMTPEEETKYEEVKAQGLAETEAKKEAIEAKENLKASARAKLMSGEALTEDEAKTVVL